MSKRSVLLLFLGDPTTDRRVQNFRRLFSEAGWDVELLSITTTTKGGPWKFWEYHRKLLKAVRSRGTAVPAVSVVLACDLYSLSATRYMRKHGLARLAIYDAREVYTELPSVAQKPLAKIVWKGLERRSMAVADLILVTAPHDLQAILDVHGFVPRSVLIRNLPWRDESLTTDRSLLDRFNIPRDATVFVYIGGLQLGRGLDIFIRAMKGLDIHFLIVGDGILRGTLETLATSEGVANQVYFAGAIESQEALRLAAACDVGVVLIEPLSKSYELALPSKVFEYMMAGIPILASKMQHVTELFPSEEWLTVVDVSDLNSIRDGIYASIEIAKRTELSSQERALAVQDFHFERDAAPLLELLERRLV